MFDIRIYIAVDSASSRTTEKQYGYILECDWKQEMVKREGFGQTQGTYHRVTLLAIIEAMERINQSCRVTIHAEDEFVLSMMEKNLNIWAAAGFVKADGKVLVNQEEWMNLWVLMQKHIVSAKVGITEEIVWIKEKIQEKKRGEKHGSK